MRHRLGTGLVVATAFVVFAVGCGTGAGPQPAGAGPQPSGTPASALPTRTPRAVATLPIPAGIVRQTGRGLRIGAPVVGSAAGSEASVLRDQGGLLDASQLSDVRFYPYGYHWLVAPDFQPSDVAAAQLVPDQRGGVAVLITFTDHGAAVFRRIAIAAAENVGAMNQIALFSGSEIFSAPQVLRAPDGPQTEVSGPFTLEQAAQIAVDIAPG